MKHNGTLFVRDLVRSNAKLHLSRNSNAETRKMLSEEMKKVLSGVLKAVNSSLRREKTKLKIGASLLR